LAQDVKHLIAAHRNQEHIMKIIFKIIAMAIMAGALAACGGGGGGGSITTGSNSTPTETAASTGIFIDSPVGGINYSTASHSGKTNTKGEFLYAPGEKVTFSIGSMALPAVTAGATVTPLDMASTTDIDHQIVSNILVLLQSLDEDGDPSNGITIPTGAAAQADTAINFDVTPSAFSANAAVLKLVANSGSSQKTLVAEAAAKTHFRDTLHSSASVSNTVTATVSTPTSTAKMNMAQTISDGAQGTTIAFSGLALMTGNLPAQSFYPPGKVADYTGFQFLRDNDPDNMGHNTSFLTRVANNVIYTLSASQLAQLSALAGTQQSQIDQYGYGRYPLMQAFRRLIDGNIPSGSNGLNLNAVKAASRALYLIDGQISFDRAVLYASIINSLTDTQKAYFDAMKGKGWSSWPDITDAQVNSKMTGLAQGSKVAVMTYASDIYSWYAGSLEADIYFCPERHGTYYGGFYIKDAPAVGHEGYSIDEQMTATAGAALIDTGKGYVTQTQATTMYNLVATQKDNLNAIVAVRTQIATLLRTLLNPSTSADTVKAQVLSLSATYGGLDGVNNYYYATTFAQVYKSLGTDQKTKLAAMRKSMMSGTYADGTAFDFSVATTPFLYSNVLTDAQIAPYISDAVTSPLFFEP
jgi:hypothetical protein